MAFESDWLVLLEDIGVWIPIEVVNKEIMDKPEGVEEPGISRQMHLTHLSLYFYLHSYQINNVS